MTAVPALLPPPFDHAVLGCTYFCIFQVSGISLSHGPRSHRTFVKCDCLLCVGPSAGQKSSFMTRVGKIRRGRVFDASSEELSEQFFPRHYCRKGFPGKHSSNPDWLTLSPHLPHCPKHASEFCTRSQPLPACLNMWET